MTLFIYFIFLLILFLILLLISFIYCSICTLYLFTYSFIQSLYFIVCIPNLIATSKEFDHLQKTDKLIRGCRGGVMVKAMDSGIVVLESNYFVHFRANTLGKGMNPLNLPAMG